jgi:hypothetical protein
MRKSFVRSCPLLRRWRNELRSLSGSDEFKRSVRDLSPHSPNANCPVTGSRLAARSQSSRSDTSKVVDCKAEIQSSRQANRLINFPGAAGFNPHSHAPQSVGRHSNYPTATSRLTACDGAGWPLRGRKGRCRPDVARSVH